MDEVQGRWVRQCLERFEGPLLLYAEGLLRDPHGAQDLVQEAFLRLLGRPRAEVEPRLPGWLYAVVRNLAFDRLRRGRLMERAASPALDERPGADDPVERAAARDQAERAVRVLESLPEKQREALRLRLQHGLAYREIAEVMDVTVNHVGVLLHEGLKSMRARLSPGNCRASEGSPTPGTNSSRSPREATR